jgi:DNA replication protein DnaC
VFIDETATSTNMVRLRGERQNLMILGKPGMGKSLNPFCIRANVKTDICGMRVPDLTS